MCKQSLIIKEIKKQFLLLSIIKHIIPFLLRHRHLVSNVLSSQNVSDRVVLLGFLITVKLTKSLYFPDVEAVKHDPL